MISLYCGLEMKSKSKYILIVLGCIWAFYFPVKSREEVKL